MLHRLKDELDHIIHRGKHERVLFVCLRNSARSQMAEALLNAMCGDRYLAESAGIEPGTVNPLAIRAMAELGIDISQKGTQSAFDLFKAGRLFSYVVTVCDQVSAEMCPIFPGIVKRLHWNIEDPAVVEGSDEECMRAFRTARDEIQAKIDEFCGASCSHVV